MIDTTRLLLAKWDLWRHAVEYSDHHTESEALARLRDSVEAIRAPLAQGQPTAAELLSELTTALLGWKEHKHLDDRGDLLEYSIEIARRARSLGYGVAHPKAVAP